MKTYTLGASPVLPFGLDHCIPSLNEYWRLDDTESRLVSEDIRKRSKTTAGGRVRFRTNAKEMTIRLDLKTLGLDICMAICASSGADVYAGKGIHSRYLGQINPKTYDNHHPEQTFRLNGDLQDITVNLPRNEEISGLSVTVNDDADVLEPSPYTRSGKICFYGSSITEGGCCSRPGNAYTAVVSRWLDCDYMNLGFSGAAKGEDAMADIIADRQFSCLVYDYDHNAPSAEHLEKTHAAFFRRIRNKCPRMPVIFMTKPDFDSDPDNSALRREIIHRTYANALSEGDKNVYFLDGETFFGVLGRDMCTVDGCHPNDLGFFRMAEIVYGLMIRIPGIMK